jgi:effector-binding domain-containing protein
MVMQSATISATARVTARASAVRMRRINVCVLTDRFTAVVRGEMPREALAAWLVDAIGAVRSYLLLDGIAPAGPPFARFTTLGDAVAVEAGFPVTREVPGDGHVEPSTLPDGCAAVTTHRARYEDLDQAYETVKSWLIRKGCRPAGPYWEVYYRDPSAEPDPRRWRTEVVVPYRVD